MEAKVFQSVKYKGFDPLSVLSIFNSILYKIEKADDIDELEDSLNAFMFSLRKQRKLHPFVFGFNKDGLGLYCNDDLNPVLVIECETNIEE